jgi:Bax protein
MKKLSVSFIFVFLLVCFFYAGYKTQKLHKRHSIISYKAITNSNQIIPVISKNIQPVVYTSVISLNNLPIKTKKQKFISLILPSILLIKQKIKQQRQHIRKILLTYMPNKKEVAFLEKMMQKYNVTNPHELLKKMILPPNSLILAQAAVESGWGTSRFFVQANNIFGIWSFDEQDNRIKAKQSRNGYTVHVMKYPSIQQSIRDYLLTLSTNKNYKGFRKALQTSKDPYLLADKLQKYSELREIYTQRLHTVISQNNLTRYDDCRLYRGIPSL